MAVDLMIYALQSIWNFDRNSLYASVRQGAPPSYLSFTFFFFSVSCLPQSLMLECLHFSHTTGFLHYDGWMTLQLERFVFVLLLSVLVVYKHLFCIALWLITFVLLCCLIGPVIWTTSLQ